MTHTAGTLAILASPDRASPPSPSSHGVLAKISRVARYRRNPRPPEYMRMLAATVLPGVECLEIDVTVPSSRVAAAKHIVLLWPDAIGHGWAPIERAVFRAKHNGATVSALSGRRRSIALTPRSLRSFRIRRLVERLWLGEAAFALALLAAAPFLVVWDFLRGRR